MDGRWGIGDSSRLLGYVAKSETPGMRGDDLAYRLHAARDTVAWSQSMGYTKVGEHFNPEVGFLRRTNYEKGEFFALRRIRPDSLWGLHELRPHIAGSGYWDDTGYWESGFLHVDNHWEWRNGLEIHTGVNFLHEGVKEAFEINKGTFVLPGEYDDREVQLVYETDEGRPLSTDVIVRGEEAPAAGWITSVEVRDGAVWGHVEWTDRAAAMIAAREYRFLSPEFTHSKAGEILALAGAGLVNRPALVMTALSRTQEPPMSLTSIAAALNLAADADEPAVLARIRAATEHRAALCHALDLDASDDPDADASAILKAIAGLKAAAKDAVPASELARVSADLADTRKALAALQEKDREREIDAALDEAAAAGKITPASRDQYRAMCVAEGGLDRFRALAKTLPVICEPSDLDRRPARTSVDDEPDPTALAREARKLVDERAAAGEVLSVSEAVEIVQARA